MRLLPNPEFARRVAWQPSNGLEVAVVGKNLHDARHVEWPAGAGANDEIQCSVYLDLTIRYTASDGSGNETTAKPTVMVPHSKKP